jgi:hypothetical protein
MKLPRFIRQWLWERQMASQLKNAKNGIIENPFIPKRCVLLYPADHPAWEQIVRKNKQLWPSEQCDFAFIGYHERTPEGYIASPPHHNFDDKMLGAAYNLPATWLANWSKPTDLLLVANPKHANSINSLAAQLPAFFRVSVYETDFGELYSFVLQAGPENPVDRLETLRAYLQKIMQL